MLSFYLRKYKSTEMPVKTIMLFQFLILVTASNVLSGSSPVFLAVHQGGNFINFFFSG